jgi:hypothetical protein
LLCANFLEGQIGFRLAELIAAADLLQANTERILRLDASDRVHSDLEAPATKLRHPPKRKRASDTDAPLKGGPIFSSRSGCPAASGIRLYKPALGGSHESANDTRSDLCINFFHDYVIVYRLFHVSCLRRRCAMLQNK